MRLLIDTLVALMLAGLLAGILLLQRHAQEERLRVEDLRTNVRLIEQQVMVQAALERVPRNEYGFPATIDPSWFGEAVPMNTLADVGHPWVELAPADELSLSHPRHRVLDDGSLATFWYNPRLGIVRARVPQMVSDRRTLEVYNFVNGSMLKNLFSVSESDQAGLPNRADAALSKGASPTLASNINRSLAAPGRN